MLPIIIELFKDKRISASVVVVLAVVTGWFTYYSSGCKYEGHGAVFSCARSQ